MGKSSLKRVTRKPLIAPQSTPTSRQAAMDSAKARPFAMPPTVSAR